MIVWDEIKKFDGENPDVIKYVFTKCDAVAEAVLYKYGSYEERTVLCISTQSGCPVGCVFCGTGKQFNRSLTSDEIAEQVHSIMSDIGVVKQKIKRFQIMFMSMGEPMLNMTNMGIAITNLNRTCPNAELLISTIGIDNDDAFGHIIELSKNIDKVGLQFSVHRGIESLRDSLIPYKNKMSLRKLRDAGIAWWKATNRPVYLNFILPQFGFGLIESDVIKNMFSPVIFNLTFSVLCENEDGKVKSPAAKIYEADVIAREVNHFVNHGYNVRAFDPAGQDDIGGGCGQLWYVQKWFNNRNLLSNNPNPKMVEKA